jgi:hypothetical protein
MSRKLNLERKVSQTSWTLSFSSVTTIVKNENDSRPVGFFELFVLSLSIDGKSRSKYSHWEPIWLDQSVLTTHKLMVMTMYFSGILGNRNTFCWNTSMWLDGKLTTIVNNGAWLTPVIIVKFVLVNIVKKCVALINYFWLKKLNSMGNYYLHWQHFVYKILTKSR